MSAITPKDINVDLAAPDIKSGLFSTKFRLAFLSLAVFSQFGGAFLIIPILPIYLRARGISPSGIGFVVAVFFLATLIAQYPAGKISDSFGRMPTFIFGLVSFAFGALLLILNPPYFILILARGLQGLGAGSFLVTSNSFVSDITTKEKRAKAFGVIFGVQNGSICIGAFFGGLFGIKHTSEILWSSVGLSIFAIISTILATHGIKNKVRSKPEDNKQPIPFSFLELIKSPLIKGAMAYSVGLGFISGMYETTWTPLLIGRGAATWQVGLSWLAFGLPFLILSWPAGHLAERGNKKVLACSQVIFAGAIAALYPALPSVRIILIFGVIEAIAVVPGGPAMQTLVTANQDPSSQGRIQGIILSAQMATQAIAAISSGFLWGYQTWLPFVVAGTITFLMGPAAYIFWSQTAKKI